MMINQPMPTSHRSVTRFSTPQALALAVSLALVPLAGTATATPVTAIALQLEEDLPHAEHEALLNGEESQLYTCSMHPEVRSEDPDEPCPICGMDLIPMERGEASELSDISFSDRSLALLRLQIEPARLAVGHRELQVSGRIAYDDDERKNISAWVSGRLEHMAVTRSGQEVARGDVVARIYSPELLVAQEELLQAHRQQQSDAPAFLAESNATTYRAARERLRLLGLSASQIDTVIEQGEAREHIDIVAPAGGTVIAPQVREGDYVDTGDTLFELADLNQVWAVLDVYEGDLPMLTEGQSIDLKLAAFPEHAFTGEVTSLAPDIDAQRRVREVRVTLSNEAGLLTPGALTRARVQVEQDETLQIPSSAPLITGTRALVYVQDPDNEAGFAAREITLGQRLGDFYQVLDGLEPDELVVSRGAFRIDSELQIRGEPSMMAPDGNGGGGHDHGEHETDATAEEAQDDHDAHEQATADEAHDDHDEHEGESAAAEAYHGLDVPSDLAQADLSAADLEPLFSAYEGVWQSLHEDNLSGWQTAAAEFFAAAKDIDWPGDLASLKSALTTGAGHAHHVQDLDTAREQFYDHAGAMIALARAGWQTDTWHLAFCPMARNNEGAFWLQPDRELLNPYFGEQMLRCGDMLDELPPANGGGHAHE